MGKIGIYKITSPSGRVYIGQSVNIKSRMNLYKSLKCKNQPRIYASLLKYGFDSHLFEIIDICDPSSLNDMERYWQDYYNSCDRVIGLNCVLTNTDLKPKEYTQKLKDKIGSYHKGKTISDEHKKILSIANKGKLMSVSTRQKISKTHLGVPKSIEHRLKLSKSKKGKQGHFHTETHKEKIRLSGNPRARKVVNTNNGIIFGSVIEAAISIKMNRLTLSSKLNGVNKNDTGLVYYNL